jgi:hypothetical protein
MLLGVVLPSPLILPNPWSAKAVLSSRLPKKLSTFLPTSAKFAGTGAKRGGIKMYSRRVDAARLAFFLLQPQDSVL